jgi:hypothetical protein
MGNEQELQPSVDPQSSNEKSGLQRAHEGTIEAWYRAREEENAARVEALFAKRHLAESE